MVDLIITLAKFVILGQQTAVLFDRRLPHPSIWLALIVKVLLLGVRFTLVRIILNQKKQILFILIDNFLALFTQIYLGLLLGVLCTRLFNNYIVVIKLG